MSLDISLITQLVAKPVLMGVLKEIWKTKSGSGWSLAKKLDTNPNDVEQALGELQSLGLLGNVADAPGLDGIYYPTTQGLQLGDDLKAR